MAKRSCACLSLSLALHFSLPLSRLSSRPPSASLSCSSFYDGVHGPRGEQLAGTRKLGFYGSMERDPWRAVSIQGIGSCRFDETEAAVALTKVDGFRGRCSAMTPRRLNTRFSLFFQKIWDSTVAN